MALYPTGTPGLPGPGPWAATRGVSGGVWGHSVGRSLPVGRCVWVRANVRVVADRAPLAQLAEQRTLNPRVRGSSPWRRTTSIPNSLDGNREVSVPVLSGLRPSQRAAVQCRVAAGCACWPKNRYRRSPRLRHGGTGRRRPRPCRRRPGHPVAPNLSALLTTVPN